MASPTFLDANAIIYALDETSKYNEQAVATIQKLLKDGSELCTSHHVIEEVIYVAVKITNGQTSPRKVITAITKIPGLVLIEPAADIAFAKRYAELCESFGLGVNDALLLQLMLDSGLSQLFSYDKQFTSKAAKMNINSVL